MADQPLDRSLKMIHIMYRISGMNIEDRKKTWTETARYIFHFIWIATDAIMAVQWLIQGVFTGVDFMQLTHIAPCFSLGVLAEFKTFFIVIYEKTIQQLINTLRELEKTRLSSNPVGKAMADEDTKTLGILIKVLITVNIVLLVLFNFGPLVIIAVKYHMTGELELLLPFLDVYPFDGYDLRYWPFAYLHEVWTACIVLNEIFAVDFLFYICCTHIRIQFKLLQQEAEHLIPTSVEEQEDVRRKVGDFVVWHQTVINSANTLGEIYSKSTLYNYMISSIIICLTGFNVMAAQDIAIVVTFAIISLVGMLQIYFLCLFGDILMNSSTDVSTAAYSSKWYLADESVRKTTLMIQTRSQKPCKLTAANFADVNLRAFMKILSTSWSYFALLQTMYASDKT